MMDRRALLWACGVVLAPAAARAQPARKVHRVGYLGYTAANTAEDDRVWGAFVQRLRELGFSEGENLMIEQRFAEGYNDRYVALAAELVELKVDVVVASSGTAARAVMAASRTIPIVTTAIPDPVRAGLIASFARPGGQLTGVSNLADELVPKRLELLKAAVPAAAKIAYARCTRCNLSSGASEAAVNALHAEHEAAARSLGVAWLPIEVSAAEDFDAASALLRRERPDALLIGATPINVALRSQWIALGVEQRLPTLAPARQFGATLSYGPDFAAVYRKAAEYVAKILGGARPGELPMEQPTAFELVVNLKMTRAIGLTIPRSLLLRADEVIE
jgi:putative tryptophan/tyrosine transport system substrate-binding protein